MVLICLDRKYALTEAPGQLQSLVRAVDSGRHRSCIPLGDVGRLAIGDATNAADHVRIGSSADECRHQARGALASHWRRAHTICPASRTGTAVPEMLDAPAGHRAEFVGAATVEIGVSPDISTGTFCLAERIDDADRSATKRGGLIPIEPCDRFSNACAVCGFTKHLGTYADACSKRPAFSSSSAMTSVGSMHSLGGNSGNRLSIGLHRCRGQAHP